MMIPFHDIFTVSFWPAPRVGSNAMGVTALISSAEPRGREASDR
jgi:hypothetical protein